MGLIVTIKIDGTPVPKGRPRFARVGGFVRTYTDAKTVNFETHVKLAAKVAMGASEPWTCPIDAYLYFALTIPASASKKAKQAMSDGTTMHTKKPDLDNLIKSVLDGLKGTVFMDDGQIVNIHSTKVYSETPHTQVMLMEC
jgi:Holliday junction resolvase RusA-like endonuclease